MAGQDGSGREPTAPSVPLGGQAARGRSGAGLLQPGTVLQERYRIKGLHDAGGSATLYLAERLGIDEPVPLAIKELPGDAVAAVDQKTEVQLLFALSHPNLPKVYDFFKHGGRYYLVMDYIEGTPLDDLVRTKGPLGEEQACEIGLQICGIFAYLHSRPQKILHRDLKPANLILDRRGQVKLVDFGIAQVVRRRRGEPGVHAFTEQYASPEQREGRRTDERSDIYSFGATLHHLLHGEPPKGPVPGPRPGRHAPTWHLEAIIARCLDPDPEHRYPSFEALEQDLLAYLELKRAGAVDQLPAEARRRRLLSRPWWQALSPARRGTVVALLLVLLIGSAAAGVAGVEAYRAAVRVRMRPVPVVGADRVLLGTSASYQVTLPEGRLGPGEQVTWRVMDALNPGLALPGGTGTGFRFRPVAAGEFVLQAFVGPNPVSEPKTVRVYQDFAFVTPSDVVREVGVVVPGYTGTVAPVPAVVLDPDSPLAQAHSYCWRWTVTAPDGATQVVADRRVPIPLVFSDVGAYEVRLETLIGPAGDVEATCRGEGQTVKVVEGATRRVEVRPLDYDPADVARLNGSFEVLSGGRPIIWTVLGEPRVAVTQDAARTGSRALRFRGVRSPALEYATQQLLLKPGGRYRVTAWIRGAGITGGVARLQARFHSTVDDRYIMVDQETAAPVQGGFEWRQLLLVIAVPPDKEPILELYLRYEGDGTLWFDDVYVEEMP